MLIQISDHYDDKQYFLINFPPRYWDAGPASELIKQNLEHALSVGNL